MAGKTIMESKEARCKDKDSKSSSATSSSTTPAAPSARVPVSVKGQDGRAYLMLMDPIPSHLSSIPPRNQMNLLELPPLMPILLQPMILSTMDSWQQFRRSQLSQKADTKRMSIGTFTPKS